jgi:hypothetical protein
MSQGGWLVLQGEHQTPAWWELTPGEKNNLRQSTGAAREKQGARRFFVAASLQLAGWVLKKRGQDF